jgi:hypothetical protein
MSTESPRTEAIEAPPLPPAPDSFRALIEIPGIRNYLFAGLGALAMIFMIMFAQNSDVGGLLLVILGAAGMVFRWTAVPTFFLLFLLWFLVFPFGVPPAYTSSRELTHGNFRVADVLLAFSVVIYLASHFRIYALTRQALPAEAKLARKRPKPTRRPVDLIPSGELPRLLSITAGAVIAAQFIWLIVTSIEIDTDYEFPFVAIKPTPTGQFIPRRAGTRVLLLLGIAFFGVLLARLVFGYWRLRIMTASEAGMLLQDAGWNETRRESSRIEKWRIWGKNHETKKSETKHYREGARP